jgi:sugar lactone lactonase YvrE
MITFVIEKLLGLIGPIANLSKERRELRDNALNSICLALDETYLYYRDLDHGRPRNLDREAQLAKYWSAAAIPIRHIDADLALTCDQKSEYWLNPETWGDQRVREVGIALDGVRTRYRSLLHR